MKKTYRIRRRQEFQELYEHGRSLANRAAVLYVLPRREGRSAVGFAAGRKLGKAVVRNRLKRLLREAVRQLWPRVIPGTRMLLIARAAAKDMPFQIIAKRVEELMNKAGLLVERSPEG